ncbi:ATP-binding SpoIIE family protein phosphatase [Halorhodospira halochloris]|uniref:ATP-binding SpoIIE family protein phosphatase n=1 Tax=Halorhodospira halochloris TaxID=1052 RepID=UPI001EE88CC6|nr:SpoIIE family protein phosphatase [Halorhodospira halochloris]MCG5548856.1 SpoIIE family protein phosphatase [Halorhodospira halochloris]
MRLLKLRTFIMATVVAVAIAVFGISTFFSSLIYENILTRQAEQGSESIARQTFESMFQVMRLGWSREELESFINVLEDSYQDSPIRVTIYRGELVDSLYGSIEGEPEKDDAVYKAIDEREVRKTEKGDLLRHIMPVQTRDECQDCHTNADVGDVLGVVEVSQDISTVKAEASAGHYWLMAGIAPLALLLAATVGYLVNRRIKYSVEAFGNQVEQVNAVKDIHLIEPRTIDLGFADLNRVMESVDDLVRRLKAIAVDKDILKTHQDRLEQEQEKAEQIVAKALDSAALQTPGLRYFYRPAAILSGDLILAEYRANGNLLVLIGDFTGHGIGAAVGVPGVAEIFYERVRRGAHPAEVLDLINDRLYRTLPPDMFMGAALVEVDYANNRLGVWNGGMPPLWLLQGSRVVATFQSSELPLGIVSDQRGGRRRISYHDLPAGGYLYACSDGVVEAALEGGWMYGAEGVEKALTSVPPGQGFDKILEQLEIYWDSNESDDDTTLLELDLDQLLARGPKRGVGMNPAAPWQAELVLDAGTLGRLNPVPSIMDLLSDLGALEEHQQSLYFIIAELYNNALEHGLLGLDSSLKRTPEGFEEYYRQRSKALNELNEGEIRIRISSHSDQDVSDGKKPCAITIDIVDSGPGFDYQEWMAVARAGNRDGQSCGDSSTDAAMAYELNKPAGRGISMVRELADSLEYWPPGNRVVVSFSGVSKGDDSEE